MEVMEQPTPSAQTETDDLVAAVHLVVQNSTEPLTVSKVRALLPSRFKALNVEDCLSRQVAANVLYQYPKYRSQQDRYWDRPMPIHVAHLLMEILNEGPVGLSELRRKLPAYAQPLSEEVLQEMVSKGTIYRHPRGAGRGGDRFGVRPADPRDYLRPEIQAVFQRLAPLGFEQEQLRAAALEMLHEEEWAPLPAREPKTASARGGSPTETRPTESPA